MGLVSESVIRGWYSYILCWSTCLDLFYKLTNLEIFARNGSVCPATRCWWDMSLWWLSHSVIRRLQQEMKNETEAERKKLDEMRTKAKMEAKEEETKLRSVSHDSRSDWGQCHMTAGQTEVSVTWQQVRLRSVSHDSRSDWGQCHMTAGQTEVSVTWQQVRLRSVSHDSMSDWGQCHMTAGQTEVSVTWQQVRLRSVSHDSRSDWGQCHMTAGQTEVSVTWQQVRLRSVSHDGRSDWGQCHMTAGQTEVSVTWWQVKLRSVSHDGRSDWGQCHMTAGQTEVSHTRSDWVQDYVMAGNVKVKVTQCHGWLFKLRSLLRKHFWNKVVPWFTVTLVIWVICQYGRQWQMVSIINNWKMLFAIQECDICLGIVHEG